MTEDKSKSQKKRESRTLQALGARLATLPENDLNRMDLPETLREALYEMRRIKSREARRRQLQYIAAVMRRVDAAPIQQALEALDRRRGDRARQFQLLERWRDALIAGGTPVTAPAMAAFPQADSQELSRLIAAARTERSDAARSRAAKALFRYLRHISADSLELPSPPSPVVRF